MGHQEEFNDVRKAESRRLLQRELDCAFGVYIADEPTKGDVWRNQSIWDLFKHLEHEVDEIHRSKNTERKYHNALDACGLAALLAARVRELEKESLLEASKQEDGK